MYLYTPFLSFAGTLPIIVINSDEKVIHREI